MKKTILRAMSGVNRISNLVLNRFGYPVLVLMYHRVLETCYKEQQYAVALDSFYDQINYVRDEFELLRFEDDWSNINRPGCVITFDDGYYDNYLIARDFLEPESVPATFFITTQNLDTDRIFWWDTLMLNKRFYMKVTQRSLAEITMALKNSSPDAINTFFLKYPAPQYNHADFRSMSSSELYGLSEFTCSTIGVHTVNHPRLTILDEQGIFEELRVSKHTIEKTVGAKVSVCSFPFGAYDPRVLKACNQLGFEKAATTSGRNAYHWQHALKIPRINVENTGIDEFRRTIDKHLLGYR